MSRERALERGRRAAGASLCAVLPLVPGCDGSSAGEPPPPRISAPDDQGQAPFRARRERPLPGKPEGLCTGDFDGDGFLDLAATLLSPGRVLVWDGGKGGLSETSRVQPCGDFPLAPLALPLGTFGAHAPAQALATCSRTAGMLEIDAAVGQRAKLRKTPRAWAAGVAHGRAVIAIACDGKRLEVLRDGAKELESFELGGEMPRCVFVDAEQGVAIVGFQDTASIEARSLATGELAGTVVLGGIPRAFAALDFDADGDLELAVAGGDQQLWILGDGAPGGSRAWFLPRDPRAWSTGAIPIDAAAADFDADGRADLALLHHYHLTAALFTNLSARDAQRTWSVYAGQTPRSLAALDFDGDGALDLAVANRDSHGLGLLRGDGRGGLESAESVPLGDFPNALAVNASSASPLRLVAIDAKSKELSAVVRHDGKLSTLQGVPSGKEPRAPRIGELDSEPGSDVIYLATGTSGTLLMRCTGDVAGALAAPVPTELGGTWSDLLPLDVDGDGKLELALCDPNAALVALLDGAAASAPKLAGISVTSAPRALAAIELDGDPAPEIACVLGAPGARVGVALLDAKQSSSGALLLREVGYCALPGAPLHAASADLDGDGWQDLAVVCADEPGSVAGGWYALLRKKGQDVKFAVGEKIPTGQRPHRIAAADVAGDGRAEVFVAAQDSHVVNAWTAWGAPQPGVCAVRRWEDLGAGLGPLDLAVVDVDSDGVLDLAVVNGFSNDASVLYGLAPAKASSNSGGR